MTDRPDEPDLVGALLDAWQDRVLVDGGRPDAEEQAIARFTAAEAALRIYIESLKARADLAADLDAEIRRLRAHFARCTDCCECFTETEGVSAEQAPDRG